jgi:hypothetical protein
VRIIKRFETPVVQREPRLLKHYKAEIDSYLCLKRVHVDNVPRNELSLRVLLDQKPVFEQGVILPRSITAAGAHREVWLAAALLYLCAREAFGLSKTMLQFGFDRLCHLAELSEARIEKHPSRKDRTRTKRLTANEIRKDATKKGRELQRRLMRLSGPTDGRSSKFSLSNLVFHHYVLKPLWQRASELAKSAQHSKVPRYRKEWKEEVRNFFEEHGYPEIDDDLIRRLDMPSNWPDELAITLEKHGAETKPYDIALEHAARQCDLKYSHYDLTLRQLKNQLKTSRIGLSDDMIAYIVRRTWRQPPMSG